MNIGDKVKITSQGHARWGAGPMNPVGEVGVIVKGYKHDPEWTRVEWPDGNKNSYKDGDIELVIEKPIKVKGLRLKQNKAGQYNLKGLSFEDVKALAIVLGTQCGEFGRKNYDVFLKLAEEVEKTDPDYAEEYYKNRFEVVKSIKGE